MSRIAAVSLVCLAACTPTRALQLYVVPDAGQLDGGDAGHELDAGADASTPDAGDAGPALDGGQLVDAGADAGPIPCSSIFDCPVTCTGASWDCFQGYCVDDVPTGPCPPDAGYELDDAGINDAGQLDAGTSDGGPGCGSGCPVCCGPVCSPEQCGDGTCTEAYAAQQCAAGGALFAQGPGSCCCDVGACGG